MAFQPCPGIAMCEVIFTADSQRMENVFHLVKSGAWSSADLEDAYNAFRDWIDGAWADNAVDNWSCVGFKGTDLTESTGATFEPTFGEAVVGGRSLPGLPTSNTVAISWKTALRGRSYRGRTYHVGLGLDDVSDSALTPTAIAALSVCYSELLAGLISAGMQLCVLSRVNNKAVRAEGIGTPVTSLSIDANLDSQRRRLPGRGT